MPEQEKEVEQKKEETQAQETEQVADINKSATLEDLDKAEEAVFNEDKSEDLEDKSKEKDKSTGKDKVQKKEEQPAEKKETDTKKEKTPIPEDFRKKFDIPDKFKFMEDFVAWGREAEKAKSLFDAEKNKAIAEKEKYKKEADELKEKLSKQVKEGLITPEEKQQAIETFKEKFEIDPISALKDVMKVFDLQPEQKKEEQDIEAETPQQKKEIAEAVKKIEEQALIDYQEITAGLNEETKQQLNDDLQAIAKEFPDVVSVKALHMIYLGRQHLAEKKLREEEEIKNKEKKGVVSIEAGKAGDEDKTSMDAIKGAKSLKELEAMEEKL